MNDHETLARLEKDVQRLQWTIIEICRSLPPEYLYGGRQSLTDILDVMNGKKPTYAERAPG